MDDNFLKAPCMFACVGFVPLMISLFTGHLQPTMDVYCPVIWRDSKSLVTCACSNALFDIPMHGSYVNANHNGRTL